MIYRFDASLLLANAKTLRDEVLRLARAEPRHFFPIVEAAVEAFAPGPAQSGRARARRRRSPTRGSPPDQPRGPSAGRVRVTRSSPWLGLRPGDQGRGGLRDERTTDRQPP